MQPPPPDDDPRAALAEPGVRPAKAATVKEVAAAAGVTGITVSRVFSGNAKVAEATRARVLAAAEQLRYRPNRRAQMLRTGRSNLIGLLFAADAPFVDGIYARLIRELSIAASRRGLDLVLIPTVGGVERWGLKVSDQRVDGCLVVQPMPRPLVGLLSRYPVPVVFLNLEADGTRPQVNVDDVAGGRAAAEHLYGLGHRRIGLVLWPEDKGDRFHYSVRQREEGVRAAAAAAGRPKPTLYRARPEGTATLLERLEKLTPARRPTGLIFYTDETAAAFHASALDAGVRLPDAYSTIGFNDQSAEQTWPSLTSVALPLDEMAELGVERLQRVIGVDAEGNPPGPVGSPEPLAPRLVVRASTAPPRADG